MGAGKECDFYLGGKRGVCEGSEEGKQKVRFVS